MSIADQRIYRNFFRLIFIVLSVLTSKLCSNESEPQNGSLIVTYRTDDEKTRLDRVRFWLINENQERRLYPQGDAFVQNEEGRARTVLIEPLPCGEYTLQFLVPNRDRIFGKVPAKAVTMSSGSIVKVDQTIVALKQVNSPAAAVRDDGCYGAHIAGAVQTEQAESLESLALYSQADANHQTLQSSKSNAVEPKKSIFDAWGWRFGKRRGSDMQGKSCKCSGHSKASQEKRHHAQSYQR